MRQQEKDKKRRVVKEDSFVFYDVGLSWCHPVNLVSSGACHMLRAGAASGDSWWCQVCRQEWRLAGATTLTLAPGESASHVIVY